MNAAIITGASGGIGSVLCEQFQRAGYYVLGIDRRSIAEHCDATIECNLAELCAAGPRRDEISGEIRRRLAGRALDVLVNNASVQILGAVEAITPDDWTTTMTTNVHVPLALTQLLLDDLARARGCVINIASIHAVATKPRFVSYATSKAALIGLTRAMAVDLDGRVRVNAIVPAAIDTPMLRDGFQGDQWRLERLASMHPSGRLGTAHEVAQLALFMSSQAVGFANGAVWNIDGAIGSRLHDPQ